MLKESILLSIMASLIGCASPQYYSFQNIPTRMQTLYEKGSGKSTTTEDAYSAVSVGFKNIGLRGDVYSYFQICVFNKTNSPTILDRNNITIEIADKIFRPWTYNETLSLIQRGFNAHRQSVACSQALAIFANVAASQTYSSTTQYGTVNAYGSNGGSAAAYLSGQSYTTGIDSTALAVRNAETQRISASLISQMSAEEQEAITQIQDYLGIVSVQPNSMVCGKICISNEVYQYGQFTILIKFNGRNYSYLFSNIRLP